MTSDGNLLLPGPHSEAMSGRNVAKSLKPAKTCLPEPVSYTHLDVYKRQRQHMLFRADELDEQRYGSFAAVEEPRQLNEDDREWLVYVSKLNNN